MLPIQLFPKKLSQTKKYRIWSPTAMTSALQSIREQNMSVRKAAIDHNVPVTTLRDRVDGRISEETVKSGPDPLLTQEEEARLVKHITYMAELGFGFTRAQVIEIASDLAVHMGKRDKSQHFSMKWFYGFLSRWPELHVVKPRGLASIRAQSASPGVVNTYFNELKSTMIKYGLLNKPEAIYNLDEKGISTEHRPPNVVSARGIPAQAITSPRAANTTIIGCGNALGQQIPPYYVFAGKRMRDELLNGSLPGTAGTVTDKGWSTSAVFETYLKEHFQKYVRSSPDNPVLLLFDGHASHLTLSVIEWAKQIGIHLFVFPPHCSHILQPMDVGCFGPLEKIYSTESLAYLRKHPGQIINRHNICEISSKAYTHALSPENLRSAFRKAGVYPWNPQAIDQTKLTPHSIFDIAVEPGHPAPEDVNLGHPAPADLTMDYPAPADVNLDHPADANPDHPAPADTNTNSQHTPEHIDSSPSAQPSALHAIDDDQINGVGIHCRNEENGPNAEEFFSCLNIVSAKQNKGKKRKSLHPIVSGRAITEESVICQMKKYKQENPSKLHVNKKTCKPKPKTKKTQNKSNLDTKKNKQYDSPQPGPSAFYVEDSNEDEDSSSTDDESSKCCVCHRHSPPTLRECTDVVIAKWCQCDKCHHWTHLRFCCKVRTVRRHTEFMCPCCET